MTTTIKPQELRIGNLVADSDGNIVEVESIDASGINIGFDNSDPTYSSPDLTFDQIKPIPLTEEWLVRFGAEKVKENVIVYGRFKLVWKSNYNYWYVLYLNTQTYLTKLDTVHEWQNFIFVMDGHELTLNK